MELFWQDQTYVDIGQHGNVLVGPSLCTHKEGRSCFAGVYLNEDCADFSRIKLVIHTARWSCFGGIKHVYT